MAASRKNVSNLMKNVDACGAVFALGMECKTTTSFGVDDHRSLENRYQLIRSCIAALSSVEVASLTEFLWPFLRPDSSGSLTLPFSK